MFRWSKPNRDSVIAFLSAQQNEPFSYADVGSSRREAPKGYIVDHNRIKLGQGVQIFERAKCAVTKWKMFDMPWIDLCWPDTPVQLGANVAVVISHLGFRSMNACRIVYVIDEHGSSEKYGFACGTLPDHGERGEERFTVELNADQTVVRPVCVLAAKHRCASGLSFHKAAAETFRQRLESGYAEGSSVHVRVVSDYGCLSGM
jgi:uncharacterized protein (UPF0548 family)